MSQISPQNNKHFSWKGPDSTGKISLFGALSAFTVPKGFLSLKFLKNAPKSLILDLSSLDSLDLNGAAILISSQKNLENKGYNLQLQNLSPDLNPIYELALKAFGEMEKTTHPISLGFVESIGQGTFLFLNDFKGLLSFLGEAVMALFAIFLRPWQGRWLSTLTIVERSVVNALPVTALVAFLVGLILAFQSAMLMQNFGVEIFVADLVGISIIRELGTLLTAIVLTGRTGSAFSSELASMKSNQEIDALVTMGLSPVRDLALPRIIALTIATPFLTVLADLAGLLGGNIVMMSIGHPFQVFWEELSSHVDISDLSTGLFKAFVFGFTVAVIGCQRGLYAGDGPTAVGEATTRGVVTNIIAIAILDSLFAVLFYALAW